MDAIVTQSGIRLLQALERSSVSPGAELRSFGPLAEPPRELSEAFEQELRRIDPSAAGGSALPQTDAPADWRQAGDELERVLTGPMRPEELFRLQYTVGMLKVHATAGLQTAQQLAQGLESALKQNG